MPLRLREAWEPAQCLEGAMLREIVVEDETPGECLGRYCCAAGRYLAAFALRLDLR